MPAVYADERGSLRAAVISGFRRMADSALLREKCFAGGRIGAECGDAGGDKSQSQGDCGPQRDESSSHSWLLDWVRASRHTAQESSVDKPRASRLHETP